MNSQTVTTPTDQLFDLFKLPEPAAVATKYDAIPQEIKDLPNWVNYALVPKVDEMGNPVLKPSGTQKMDKIPYDPKVPATRKKNASSTDPHTWGTFEQAVANEAGFAGIGFMFGTEGAKSGVAGFDADDCVANEQIAGWAESVLIEVNSYTESSPSGEGIHSIFLGHLPGSGTKIGSAELYDCKRFFAFTGKRLKEYPADVRVYDCSVLYNRIKSHEFDFSPAAKKNSAAGNSSSTASCVQIENDLGKVSTHKTNLLMTGNISSQKPFVVTDNNGNHLEYPSQSEADEALCCCLAFKYGENREKIDEEFRKSSLYREKWDREETYRKPTIQRAVDFWNQHKPPVPEKPQSKSQNSFAESGSSPTPNEPAKSPWPSNTGDYTKTDEKQKGTTAAVDVGDVHIVDFGINDMPESVLDGWLGQICKSRMLEHFPVAYAWTALVTVASAMVPIANQGEMRCNLYGCPVGGIHSGKTQAILHAKKLLGMKAPILLDLMAGSAEMLTSAVADADGCARLYSTDELGHLLEKAQIQNSSFVYLLNRAFDETGFRVRSMEQKRKEVIFNAALSIIGGVVEERFGDLFTSKTIGGFYDRFLFGLCPTGFRYCYMPFEGEAAVRANQGEVNLFGEEIVLTTAFGNQPIPVTIDKSVHFEVKRWMEDDPIIKTAGSDRITEIVVRVAKICASFDGRPVLYGKDLGPALELARYQVRIRHLLKPNPGKTFEGQLFHKFYEFLTTHTQDGSWMTRRELFRGTHAHEIGLSIANKTLDTMMANGDVEQIEQRSASGGRTKFLVRITAAKSIVTTKA